MIRIERMPLSDALGLHRERLDELRTADWWDGTRWIRSAMSAWMHYQEDPTTRGLHVDSFLAWDERELEPTPSPVFVSRVGRLVGHAMARSYEDLEPPSVAFSVFVDPSVRRRGIGRTLYRAAFEVHGRNMWFAPPNNDAVAFFRSVGASLQPRIGWSS